MEINAAYREVGTYRGAADICGTTPKTVKRAVLRAEAESVSRPGLAADRRITTTAWPTWWSSGWPGPTAGSRPRGCCRWPWPPAMGARPATFAGWWPPPRPNGGGPTTGADGRGCGRPETCWSSNGARSARCACSARCWPGAGGGLCSSPTNSGPRPPWSHWRVASRRWAACRPQCCQTDGLHQGRHRRRAGGAHPGLCPLRQPLPVPTRLRRTPRPRIESVAFTLHLLCWFRRLFVWDGSSCPVVDRWPSGERRRGPERSARPCR